MFTFAHEIAGITFRTESDVEVALLQNGLFQQFLAGVSKPDVHHQLYGIDRDTLTLAPLDTEEKERVSRCVSLPTVQGTLTLPSLIIGEEPASRGTSLSRDRLDVPLLRSPLVRSRLDACLSHPEQVGLSLHIFSVVIHDYAHRRTDIFYPSDRREILQNPYVDNGFRRMFATFLPDFSAVMVHSSGLIRNGRAALFLAPDEGGKTTVVEHSTDGVVLNDDRNIIKKEGNATFVYGTPWGSIATASDRARIGGFFLLEKASRFELIPVKPRDVVQFLWDDNLYHWRLLPRHLKIRAFEILCDACHQAPVYRMRFPKDYVDWDAIDAVMR